MFTEFYGLTGLPFQLTPDPRFFYESRTHKKAMAYLTYGLGQGEGFIVITGEIGAGKTTLVGNLLNSLDPEQYLAAKIVTTQLEADDVLRMVASAFGVPHEGHDKATILSRIEGFLLDVYDKGKRALLVIDEAQNLPNGALEELRMLSNFQIGERALMQSFLLGQPQFRDRLAQDSDLEQVRQRIIATYHLLPLDDADETREYICHRLGMVDWKDDPSFTPEAFVAIHEFCDGVPRRINTLCSRLLLFGFLEELHEIGEAVVREVISDMASENGISAVARAVPEPPQRKAAISVAASTRDMDSDELGKRVEVLEQFVSAHEHTISKALEIAKAWLEGPYRDKGR